MEQELNIVPQKQGTKEQLEHLLEEAEEMNRKGLRCYEILDKIDDLLNPFLPNPKKCRKNRTRNTADEKIRFFSNRAFIYLEWLHKYSKAYECFEELNNLILGHARFLNGSGDCLRRRGKHEEAIKKYTEALDVNDFDDRKLDASILNNRALSHIELSYQDKPKELDLAQEDLEKAIEFDSENELYLVNLGKVMSLQEKPEEALEKYKKAQDLLINGKVEEKSDLTQRKYFKGIMSELISFQNTKSEALKIESSQQDASYERYLFLVKQIDEEFDEILNFEKFQDEYRDSMLNQGDPEEISNLLDKLIQDRIAAFTKKEEELKVYMAKLKSLLEDPDKGKNDFSFEPPTESDSWFEVPGILERFQRMKFFRSKKVSEKMDQGSEGVFPDFESLSTAETLSQATGFSLTRGNSSTASSETFQDIFEVAKPEESILAEPENHLREQIYDLLQEAEKFRNNPNKYEEIFDEISRMLPSGNKPKASTKRSIHATEIKLSYLSKRIDILYDGLDDYENALKCYEEISELIPKNPKVLKGIGDCYRKLGKHRDAIRQYNEALKLLDYEDDVSLLGATLNNKALSHIELREFVAAEKDLKKAISFDQRNVLYQVTLAQLLYNQKNIMEALNIFYEVFQLLNQNGSNIDPRNERFIETSLIKFNKSLSSDSTQIEESKDMGKEGKSDLGSDVKQSRPPLTQIEILKQIISILDQKFKEHAEASRNPQYQMTEFESQMSKFLKRFDPELDKNRERIENVVLPSKPDQRKKLLEYYDGFTRTFEHIYTTSLGVIYGEMQLNSKYNRGRFISSLGSFVPYVESVASNAVIILDDIWNSQQMKKTSKQLVLLGNGNDVGQIISEAAFKIIQNKDYQQEILNVSDADLKDYISKELQKLLNFLKKVNSQIDVKQYLELYPTPAAQLGNRDANILVEKWLGQEINNDEVLERFINIIISQTTA